MVDAITNDSNWSTLNCSLASNKRMSKKTKKQEIVEKKETETSRALIDRWTIFHLLQFKKKTNDLTFTMIELYSRR